MKALIILLIFLLISCSDSYEDEVESLAKYLKKNSVGYSQDVFLIKKNNINETQWDKVAVFFGYGNDLEACEDVKDLLEQKYSLSRYRCEIIIH